MIAHAIIAGRWCRSDGMASLIVRRLDDDLVRRLKARALAQGRSAEAEHRAILEAALRPGLGVSCHVNGIILDTNVVSEPTRQQPDQRVSGWFESHCGILIERLQAVA